MNVRCGTDLVYIPRIAESIGRSPDAFLKKCYTEAERGYALSFNSDSRRNEVLAGRFAAKEAVSKALGTGILTGGISLLDMEILPADNGVPEVTLHGKAKEAADRLGVVSVSVSITHEKDYAQAFCVLLCDEED